MTEAPAQRSRAQSPPPGSRDSREIRWPGKGLGDQPLACKAVAGCGAGYGEGFKALPMRGSWSPPSRGLCSLEHSCVNGAVSLPHTHLVGGGCTALILFRVGLRGLGHSQRGWQERPFSSAQAGVGLHQRLGSWPVCVGRQSPAAGRRWRPVTGRQRPRSRAPVAPWRPQVAVMSAPTASREDTEAQRDSGQGAPTCGPGAARVGSRSKGRALSSPPWASTSPLHLAPSSLLGPGSE